LALRWPILNKAKPLERAASVLETAATNWLAGDGSAGKIEDGLKALLNCIEHA
jgi:hypothetical protein